MDVIRAMGSFEYYQGKTGIKTYSVWQLYRQQTALLWHMVVKPKIAYKMSVCVPEWINKQQEGAD